jgi:hypothetical protein
MDYAASGPAFEIDAGARISRRYVAFALWERSILRPGSLDPDSFGGQRVGFSDLFGIGVRVSTNPDDIGFLVEVALGYRWFGARWEDGTQLTASGSFPDLRLGLGAGVRLSPHLTLTPMFNLGSGVFNKLVWTGPFGESNARDVLDENAQYATMSFTLSAHYDIY